MANIAEKRHSLAHILAEALEEIYGKENVKLGFGPAIENGFYHDFEIKDVIISDENLKEIEKKMKLLISQNQKFERYETSIEEAIKKYDGIDEYRSENLKKLQTEGNEIVSFYKNINQTGKEVFDNLCSGPHVENTNQIDKNAFYLEKVAGAYWLGDSDRPMLTRIYGIAFDTAEEMQAYKTMMEEAKKRDHRILGEKLKLFTVSNLVGAGFPLLQPNGMIIRKEIEDYLWELHKNKGYQRVWTPHLAKIDLYKTSGHYEIYKENFKVIGKEEEFMVKPMNCPHHMQIFDANQFSYRDMPVRYFEPATVYRDEKSGQLSGLTRVRSITQDDGHLFCRVSQIGEEVGVICAIIKEFYETIGMTDYWVSFSVRGEGEKYLGTDEVWEKAESALEKAAKDNNLPYRRIEGEAAFYGPKLDFMFKDAIGREWQLSTIQCDFNLPERFNLSFINESGEKERPVVIHRAISGSLERFMGILIEHFAGTFPLWLSPRQAIVIPVGQDFVDYGYEVLKDLKDAGIRAFIDDSSDSLNKKVRNAEKDHYNYILVVGEEEQKEKRVSVRNYKTKEQKVVFTEVFIKESLSEIKERKL